MASRSERLHADDQAGDILPQYGPGGPGRPNQDSGATSGGASPDSWWSGAERSRGRLAHRRRIESNPGASTAGRASDLARGPVIRNHRAARIPPPSRAKTDTPPDEAETPPVAQPDRTVIDDLLKRLTGPGVTCHVADLGRRPPHHRREHSREDRSGLHGHDRGPAGHSPFQVRGDGSRSRAVSKACSTCPSPAPPPCSAFMTVFLACSCLANEIRLHQIYMIVSKPIPRCSSSGQVAGNLPLEPHPAPHRGDHRVVLHLALPPAHPDVSGGRGCREIRCAHGAVRRQDGRTGLRRPKSKNESENYAKKAGWTASTRTDSPSCAARSTTISARAGEAWDRVSTRTLLHEHCWSTATTRTACSTCASSR